VIFRGHDRLETSLDRCFMRYRSPETDVAWECLNGVSLYGRGLLDEPAVMADAVAYLRYCLEEADNGE